MTFNIPPTFKSAAEKIDVGSANPESQLLIEPQKGFSFSNMPRLDPQPEEIELKQLSNSLEECKAGEPRQDPNLIIEEVPQD